MWSSMLSPWILAMFKPILLFIMMTRYPRHCYVGMVWYHPRLYDRMMWYHPGLWDGTIRYLPEISVFSNPWEAVVEFYGNLRSCTFGYGVSLGLFHPLIMEVMVPIMWGKWYTSAEHIKSIRIATPLEWADAGMRWPMIRFTFMCNETVIWNLNIDSGTSGNGNTPLGLNP